MCGAKEAYIVSAYVWVSMNGPIGLNMKNNWNNLHRLINWHQRRQRLIGGMRDLTTYFGLNCTRHALQGGGHQFSPGTLILVSAVVGPILRVSGWLDDGVGEFLT
ncbi:hypothetical protein J6590_093441 [Homalodisca vitripennis]|nr:hypothetical protein J6590_093441 [Homalodisca vitripennis]